MANSDLPSAPLEQQPATPDAALAAGSDAPEPTTVTAAPETSESVAPPSLLWPGALMQQIQTQMRWGPDQPGTKLP